MLPKQTFNVWRDAIDMKQQFIIHSTNSSQKPILTELEMRAVQLADPAKIVAPEDSILPDESRFEKSCRVCLQINANMQLLFPVHDDDENDDDAVKKISIAERINQCSNVPLVWSFQI